MCRLRFWKFTQKKYFFLENSECSACIKISSLIIFHNAMKISTLNCQTYIPAYFPLVTKYKRYDYWWIIWFFYHASTNANFVCLSSFHYIIIHVFSFEEMPATQVSHKEYSYYVWNVWAYIWMKKKRTSLSYYLMLCCKM